MSHPELPASIATLVLRRRWQDCATENVFHVWREGPHSTATLAVLLAALESWWNGTWAGATIGPSVFDPFDIGTGGRVFFDAIGYVKVLGLGVVTRFLSASSAAGRDVPAPQAAAVVRWVTGYGGRGRTGRTYHGLIPSSMYEGAPAGRLAGGAAFELLLSYQTLITVLTTVAGVPGEFAPVLVHSRPMFPSDSSSGLWDFIVDAEITDRRVRTQRRRVPRDSVS